MRRILWAAGATLAGLAAVFAYPTSTGRTLEVGQSGDTSAGTPTADTASSSAQGATGSGSSGSTASGDSSSSSDSSSSGSSGSTTLADGTYSASTQMRYGTVTVTITVQGGQLTASTGSQSANDPHSQQIAGQAIPVLDQEAVSTGSASISLVSHATYTSEAYAQSLQQALDAAYQV